MISLTRGLEYSGILENNIIEKICCFFNIYALFFQKLNTHNLLVEKIITLEDVSLVDFLGIENNNIREVAAAFPMSKIISRGNEIRLMGTPPEIVRITDILESLLQHYQKYGKITNENVRHYLTANGGAVAPPHVLEDEKDVILYGTKGVVVKARTANQRLMVEKAAENDLLFAIGPAGTGKT